MQRHFSTFPSGLPGAGLLFARGGLGVAAVLTALGVAGSEAGTATDVLAAVTAMCGLALVIGLLTPLAAVVLAIVVVIDFSLPTIAGPLTTATVVHLVTDAVAMSLLGPGAYSLDARRFGRREIVVPNPRRP